MTDAETRGLRRAAALLLVASLIRTGWSTAAARMSSPADTSGADVLPELLARSDSALLDARARARALAPGERLDPNRAGAAELDRLPGVGPSTARAIVEERTARGPFTVTEDLLRVRGIGEATLDRLRPYLDLSSVPKIPGGAAKRRRRGRPELVDVNRAGEEALETLPGVGPALAARIVASRKEEGGFRSMEDLTRVRGIGPALAAALSGRVRFGPVR